MSAPCTRPECGGEVHTDGWGKPVQCPAARRCPRCDCPDGHEQCAHCKVCPHAGDGQGGTTTTEPQFLVALREDDGTLIVGIRPDGAIATGPNYQPNAAAREFWDAVTRAAQAANPWPQPTTSKEQA